VKREIYQSFTSGSVDLLPCGFRSIYGRLEHHIQNGGDAASRGGLRPGLEIFPSSELGISYVGVNVHNPRKYESSCCIHRFVCSCADLLGYLRYLTVFSEDVCSKAPVLKDDGAVPDEKRWQGSRTNHRLSRRTPTRTCSLPLEMCVHVC